MNIEENIRIVKDFFSAIDLTDRQGLLALSVEDIERIIPGKDCPLAFAPHKNGVRVFLDPDVAPLPRWGRRHS